MRRRKVKYVQPQQHTPEQDLHDISIMEDNDLVMQVFTTPFRKETQPLLFDGWVMQQEESTNLQKYHSNMLESRSKTNSSSLKDRNSSAKIERYGKMGRSVVLLDHQHCSVHPKRTHQQQLNVLLKLYSSREIKPSYFPSQHMYLKKRSGVTSSGSSRRVQRPSVQAVSYPILNITAGNPEKRGSSIGKVRQLMQVKRAQRT